MASTRDLAYRRLASASVMGNVPPVFSNAGSVVQQTSDLATINYVAPTSNERGAGERLFVRVPDGAC